MIDKLIELALKQSILVMVMVAAIVGLGLYQYTKLPVDAFPDISPVMVSIFAEAHGMAPEEIERLITFPIESKMNGLPGVINIKSTSAFGMAVIYVYFNDQTEMYFARQIVGERLASAMAELPAGLEPPTLGPISSGLGQIFIYYLTADSTTDLKGKDKGTFLREVNDWIVKYGLQTVSGVTDILSVGGHVLQYQISINPYALGKYGIALEQVVEAIEKNNRNAGGQFLLLGSEEYLVRGLGLVGSIDHIKSIPIKSVDGVPVKIGDIADVDFGKEIRRGVVTKDGKEEVVSGIVLQLYGENTSDVIKRLYTKLPTVQASLPEGVTIVPYYEQANLVAKANETVRESLLAGAFLITLVLLLFLGNVRSALIVVITLPLCALIASLMMGVEKMSANLMSMGGIAIAIGMLADGSIVMVENIHRHLSAQKNGAQSKFAVILQAAHEVGRPIAFSILIIVLVFLPLFTLQGVEGKMFSPMAFTICFALLGSILAALVVVPVLSMYFLKGHEGKEFIVVRKLKEVYKPLLEWVLRRRIIVVSVAVLALAASLFSVRFLGTEFIPTLEEGSILIGVTMTPSISLEKATETVMKLEQVIMKYPEVKETVSRTGRPEAGSHPHPVNSAEIHIELNDPATWQRFKNKKQLVESMNKDLAAYPGVALNFTQPIQNAFDELISGIKAQLAIKLYGDDLVTLRTKAGEIKEAIADVPGLVDLAIEQSFGQPQVQIIADRDACARYGVNVSELLEIVELAIGGEVIDQIYLSSRRFGIHVRYQEQYRNSPEAIGGLLVHTDDGRAIPLAQVAEIKKVIGPIQINRENNQRRWVLSANVRGRDLGGVVTDIQKQIKDNVNLPPGYRIEYGGQFENQQRAMSRLAVIVPLTILLIFFMLYLAFNKVRIATLIITNVPFALIGGIFGLLITGEYLSVPATVGFIALFGVAVQNGVVLVSFIEYLRKEGMAFSQAVVEGAVMRLRPVLMTALAAAMGLVPLLFSTGIGADVQRPLAVVVVFGLISSTLLTLFVIPALYTWFVPKAQQSIVERPVE
ncbi:MAG: CusA/CzcA family heavy metal efflux RND transporter [Candidatus Zixiibacteriota bacterium]